MQIGAQITRTIILATMFSAIAAPLSQALTPKNTNYLCTSEMAVGFEYNKSLKRWDAITVGSEDLFSKFTYHSSPSKNGCDEIHQVRMKTLPIIW